MVATMNQPYAGAYAGEGEARYEQVAVTDGGRVYPVVAPATPPRRMPIKTTRVNIQGEDFAGWWAEVRTNGPFAIFLDLVQLTTDGDNTRVAGAFRELLDLMPKLVYGWNFVDEEGAPLPCNREGFRSLGRELLLALVSAMSSAMGDAADPKG